jgi:hypothetical protein
MFANYGITEYHFYSFKPAIEIVDALLKMNNNKSYRLRQQNLKSIPNLNDYLEDKNVKYPGIK